MLNGKLIVARQQRILHPDITESTSLKMFEPQGNEMYYPSTSPALNERRFCEFHNSPLYNPVQIDIWQRIHTAIRSALSLHDRVDLSFPTEKFAFRVHLEEMSHVLETNHIPLVEAEEFVTEIVEPLPVDTPCPGQSFLSFSSFRGG